MSWGLPMKPKNRNEVVLFACLAAAALGAGGIVLYAAKSRPAADLPPGLPGVAAVAALGEPPAPAEAEGDDDVVPGILPGTPTGVRSAEELRARLAGRGASVAVDGDILPMVRQHFKGCGAVVEGDFSADGRPDFLWLTSDSAGRRHVPRLYVSGRDGYSEHELMDSEWAGPGPGKSCVCAWQDKGKLYANAPAADCVPEPSYEDISMCVTEVVFASGVPYRKTFCH